MNHSIVIASYGEEAWSELAMSRAYPSACAQDPFEVLVGHDPQGDIASVRNALAREAHGDWLLFLDADDELAPGYLGAMERALTQERENDTTTPLLLAPAVSYVRKGIFDKPKFWPEVSLEVGNWLVIGTMVEKSLFDEVGGFRLFPHGLEDWNFWARCVRAGALPVKVPLAVYYAHVNSKSKHAKLARNRQNYMAEYELARKDAWS